MLYFNKDIVIDKNVCSQCIGEPFIKKHIQTKGAKVKCSYCNKTINALPFSSVTEIISEGFHHQFEDVAAEWSYDKDGEHGYRGNTHDLYDMFNSYDELGLRIGDEDLVEDVKSMFDEERLYGYKNDRGSHHDDCASGWFNFQRVVKNQARFVFHFDNNFRNHGVFDPLSTLELVQESIDELGLFSHIEPNTILYRCRQHEKQKELTEASHLASPPNQYCLSNGRMNPAGISMFYCSKNKDITIKEVVDEFDDQKRYYTTGIFRNKSRLKLVDLSNLPDKPSIFDSSTNLYIDIIEFFKEFVKDVIKPIKNTDSIIEYVPTQIITEYIRYNPKLAVDGIIYPSSKDSEHKNIVLFYNHESSLSNLTFSKGSIKTVCIDAT